MTPSNLLHHCTEDALSDPEIVGLVQEELDLAEDIPLALYPGKSPSNPSLDLVQPILNGMSDIWQFEVLGWKRQMTLRELSGGLIDSSKSVDFARQLSDGRWVIAEWQFGNAGRNGTDVSKAEQLHRRGLLGLAIILRFTQATAKTADSGLATIEQMHRDRAELKDIPVLGIGLSRENTRVVDLRQLQDITFPGVLGGRGLGSKQVHAYLARAILEGADLSELRLPAPLLDIVHRYDLAHLRAETRRLHHTVQLAAQCQDPAHRLALLDALGQAQQVWFSTAPEPAADPEDDTVEVEPAACASEPADVPVDAGAHAAQAAPTEVQGAPHGPAAADSAKPPQAGLVLDAGICPEPGEVPFTAAPQPLGSTVLPHAGGFAVPTARPGPEHEVPAAWRQKARRLASGSAGALALAFERALR